KRAPPGLGCWPHRAKRPRDKPLWAGQGRTTIGICGAKSWVLFARPTGGCARRRDHKGTARSRVARRSDASLRHAAGRRFAVPLPMIGAILPAGIVIRQAPVKALLPNGA